MKPYFDDGLVTLYHGDCREITEWLTADVLVTDPPYGVNYESGARRDILHSSIMNDNDTRVRDTVLELWGEDRPALVFGSWKVEKPETTHTRLIWDTKGALGMGDLTIPWKPSDQEIYVIGRKGWTGPRTSNVLTYAPVQSTSKGGRVHPHQKPLSLLEALIVKTTGAIADPTAGSGSTLVAAQRLGRRSIGVELEEKYCEIAARRLSHQPLDLGQIA